MSACDCCDLFPIDVVGIQYQSKSIVNSRCGFLEDNDPCTGPDATVYRTETITYTAPEGQTDFEGYFKINVETNEFVAWTGEPYDHVKTYTWDAATCECDFTETGFVPEDPGTVEQSVAYSNTYSIEQLESNTVACLEDEDFGEWQDTPVDAQRSFVLSFCATGTTYSESSAKYRIVHPPTATCYLKAWIYKTVWQIDPETEQESDPVDSLFDTYEWFGEPPSPQDGIDEPANKITSEGFQITRPSINTRIEVYVAKWSLIEGYEPDDPIINETTRQLSRPVPDCLSNGVPTLNEDCPFPE